MSTNTRAHRLPFFPSIRIVDISPFHLPVRDTRSSSSTGRRRDQRAEATATLLFAGAAAARGAAVGF